MRIGLISDTHLPDRLEVIPPVISKIFHGVDLILHAGDVGELRVLDELAQIAPVIAVRGNDETVEAQRELPYAQIVFVANSRSLLTDAHYPDRTEELASRVSDDWESKLQRRVDMAKRANASVVVFGHTHIPMLLEYDGVLCVNPGAVAAGNFVTRQAIQTVAIMQIGPNHPIQVTHFDLAQPNIPFDVDFDLNLGFQAQAKRFSPLIIANELRADMRTLAAPYIAQLGEKQFWQRLRPLAFRCWRGEISEITAADFAQIFS